MALQDSTFPVLFVQECFVGPHSILGEPVLLSAGFTNVSSDIRFSIFRFDLGHWTELWRKLTTSSNSKTPHAYLSNISIFNITRISAPPIQGNLQGSVLTRRKRISNQHFHDPPRTTKVYHNRRRTSFLRLSDSASCLTNPRRQSRAPIPKFTPIRVLVLFAPRFHVCQLHARN